MRKLKLLLAACALTGASAVCAQTDVTSTYLKNADFSTTEGWTENVSAEYRDFGNGLIGTYNVRFSPATVDETHLATEYCFGLECRWSTNFASYTQTTSELPEGLYTLTFDVENVNGSTTSVNYDNLFYVQVGDNKTVDSSSEWMKGKSAWTTHSISFTVNEASTATISLGYGTGSNNIGSNNTPAIYVSHLKLTYQSLLDGLKSLWEQAHEAAETAIASEEYDYITGSERQALSDEIAKSEPSTKAGYEEAIEALNNVTKSFIDAKGAYEEYYSNAKMTEIPELPYASSTKKDLLRTAINAENATSAEDAVSKTAAITKALRAYYESNAMAEGVSGAVNVTELIKNPLAENGNNDWTWTGNKNNPASNEPWTDANNNSNHKYFDGGNWNGTSWTTTMSQAIALPAGKYLLTAKGRAATNTTLTMDVNGVNTELPNVGNTGNVFDRGWGDAYVEFETDGSDVTILVTATAEPQHEWFSISDFRLVRLEMYAQMADDDDYEALSTAIKDAEAKTLGFEDGNYAPYNNVGALQALAAAKAIDPSKENGKEMVNDLTNALTSATWTANSGEVDAIYDGQFANTEANTTSGDINLPGWTKIEGLRLLVKDESKDPGLAYTDGKAAVFSWGGTTLTYGEQAGYTLPLAPDGLYELTLKVSGWRDGDQPNVFTVGLDGQTQTVNPNTMKIDTSEGNPFETQKFYLKPTKENSILTIYANHHFTIADLSLVKATPIEVTVGSEGYATYVTEAAMDFSATDIKAYTAKVEDNKVVLTQIEKVPAKTPVVLYYEGGKTEEIPFASETDTPAESDLVAGNGGTVETEVEGFTNYILNNVSGIGFYKAAGQTVAKEHAYLHVAATSEARLQIVFDGATAISEVKSIGKGEAVYNLSGQRVNSPKKGLYIIGGKKAVLK